MNVLFVHEVEWLKKVVFDIHTLSESLSLLGHQVYAIDYENKWTKTKPLDFGTFRTREFKNVARAYPEASVCLRRPGFVKIAGLSRLSASFTHYLEIQRTIKEKDIDAIMLYSAPTNGLQTIHLAKKFNIPVLFRSIDILHQLVPYSALRSMTRIFEQQVYGNVDVILTLTPELSKYVTDLGARETKVKLLLMPVDTKIFHPSIDTSEIRQKWGLDEQSQVIVFIGTLFEFSGLDSFIQQFPRVLEQVPEVRLLIVGEGRQHPKLERIIAQLGLQNQVIMTGLQPYETMPQYINLASIAVNPFLITDATREIFPGKIVQYLACGKPVVATPLPGMLAVIPDESRGVVYANNGYEMVTEIVSLLKSSERRQQLGEAGLSYVNQVHSCGKVASELERIIEETIKEKRDGELSKKI